MSLSKKDHYHQLKVFLSEPNLSLLCVYHRRVLDCPARFTFASYHAAVSPHLLVRNLAVLSTIGVLTLS
jgi:hypothetical protein